MPNWCENNFYVSGPTEEVERFLKASKGPDRWDPKSEPRFCFNALVPTPQELVDGKKADGQNESWYNWSLENWGCKWDIEVKDEEIDKTGTPNGATEVYTFFDTTWSPPIQWLEKIAVQFPTLEFRLEYFEPGFAFVGYQVWRDGEQVTEHELSEEDEEDDGYVDLVRELFDEEFGKEDEEENEE